MSFQFPSDEWVQQLMEVVNSSQAYKEAAAKWEGDLVFLIQPGAGLAQESYLYLDLWHGDCRSAKQLQSASEEKAAFEISAPLVIWRDVLEGRLDPIRGITSRKLKLKGNLMKVLKAPKAAVELVNCARQVDTEWPT